MTLMRDELSLMVLRAVQATYEVDPTFVPEIEIPSVPEHGDYATNAAMVLAKHLKRSPREIASRVSEMMRSYENPSIKEIKVEGPGFMNFFLTQEAFRRVLSIIHKQGERYGSSDLGQGRTVQVEFVSANPTGPLHVGHGRGAAVGDAIARILTACGYRVQKEYYINDVGKQMQILGRSLYLRYLEALGREIDFPDDHYQGAYMKDLAKVFYREVGDRYAAVPEAEALPVCSAYAARAILAGIREDLADFRVTYDEWFSERTLHEGGSVEASLAFLKQRGLLYEQDGAWWFESSRFGDEKDRVVVRQSGEKTYFAADIAYHWNKIQRGFHTIVNIWGADHHGYVPRVKAVVEALGYDPDRLKIILVHLVNLLRGGHPVAMSTRAGEFITLREVMDEVGVDAARYIFLTRRSDSPLDFDLDLAKAQNSENPVYYVQYAHARISSLFEVARERGVSLNPDEAELYLDLLTDPQEVELMKVLGEFPYVVRNAATYLEPHRISYYLHGLVSTFHAYYNRQRILTESYGLTQARLSLVKAVQIVLKNAFEMVGLSAPDKM